MQSIVISLVLKWLVSYIVSAGAGCNWTAAKASVDAQIANLAISLHAGFLTTAFQGYSDAVFDALAKLSQDNADLSTLLGAVAAKDVTAAEATLKAMLLTVATGDLAKVIQAV